MHESIQKYDLFAMHERSCRAAIVLHRQLREISALMGEDVSIPLHRRKPIQPTPVIIRKAAEIIGVSVGWLVTGIKETQTGMLVIGHKPMIANIADSAIIKDSQHCTIVADHATGGAKNSPQLYGWGLLWQYEGVLSWRSDTGAAKRFFRASS